MPDDELTRPDRLYAALVERVHLHDAWCPACDGSGLMAADGRYVPCPAAAGCGHGRPLPRERFRVYLRD